MARVLVIGYGNSLRGDDALGPMAVQKLRPLLPQAEVLSCHQLAPELAEELAHSSLTIFVDASAAGEPGTVRVETLQAEASSAASLTHHATPAALLALATELYGSAPQAMLVTGAGSTFDDPDCLSEPSRRALQEICRLVPQLIQDFLMSEG